MYQKDYILRIIDMARDLILGILGLLRKGDIEKAGGELEKLYYDFLKEDSAFFTSIPAGDLTQKLLKEHNYTNGHLEILALLFNTEAEVALAKGNRIMSLEFLQKALILFEFLDKEEKTYSQERIEKISAIREKIESLKILKPEF